MSLYPRKQTPSGKGNDDITYFITTINTWWIHNQTWDHLVKCQYASHCHILSTLSLCNLSALQQKMVSQYPVCGLKIIRVCGKKNYKITGTVWGWSKMHHIFPSISLSGLRLSPFGTSAINWPIVPPPDDRWGWLRSSWWNENWQGNL
jgi:hypothetical protein